jgi:NAD+ synthase
VLPCHSQSQDKRDALRIARALGIRSKVIDLSQSYDTLLKMLPRASGLACANLKSRLRMPVLYYYANVFNYLVCGTGNKSELMVGYFTKYGDGGTDVLPIGGLLKKQVRVLAQQLGIPQDIIDKPPTAGLWLGQTDEQEMGLTYEQLDDVLERIEHKRVQQQPEKIVRKVMRMMQMSAHKRKGPVICNV